MLRKKYRAYLKHIVTSNGNRLAWDWRNNSRKKNGKDILRKQMKKKVYVVFFRLSYFTLQTNKKYMLTDKS